jgi:type II secretory pathway pseudopilin PulG
MFSRPAAGEEGYILIAVIFLMVLVLLALSLAAPKVAASIERDREVELMHRGKQYRRAIQLYYRKFQAYPPNLDALEKTTEIRFLRKRYKDPVTGKDQWHLIHFGENKTPTAMGFFGQPMGGVNGSTLAGVGPGGVGQSAGSTFGGSTFGSNSGSSIGGSSTGGMTFGGSSLPTSQTTPTTDPNTAGGSATGSSTDPSSSNSLGSNTASTFGGSGSTSGQTFGGGGIIGVESTSPKATILEYKKKKHFNEWEFTYDPQSEQRQIGGGSVGQPMSTAGNGGTSSFGSGNSFGNSNGNTFSNGNGNTFGNNGNSSTGGSQTQSPVTTPQ